MRGLVGQVPGGAAGAERAAAPAGLDDRIRADPEHRRSHGGVQREPLHIGRGRAEAAQGLRPRPARLRAVRVLAAESALRELGAFLRGPAARDRDARAEAPEHDHPGQRGLHADPPGRDPARRHLGGPPVLDPGLRGHGPRVRRPVHAGLLAGPHVDGHLRRSVQAGRASLPPDGRHVRPDDRSVSAGTPAPSRAAVGDAGRRPDCPVRPLCPGQHAGGHPPGLHADRARQRASAKPCCSGDTDSRTPRSPSCR